MSDPDLVTDLLVRLRDEGIRLAEIERAEADARRGLPHPHRPRRRRRDADDAARRIRRARREPRMTTTTPSPRGDHRSPITPGVQRNLKNRVSIAETVSQLVHDGLSRAAQDQAHPGAAVRRDAAADHLHRDVHLHLRRGDRRRRAELPAHHHPGHPRADRHHDLRRHRRAAAGGHGQGRVRPVQVAARSPASHRSPARCSPTPCATRSPRPSRFAMGFIMGYRPEGGVGGVLVARPARDRLLLGHQLDLRVLRRDRPHRLERAGHLDARAVPAHVPVERLRSGRHHAGLAAVRS